MTEEEREAFNVTEEVKVEEFQKQELGDMLSFFDGGPEPAKVEDKEKPAEVIEEMAKQEEVKVEEKKEEEVKIPEERKEEVKVEAVVVDEKDSVIEQLRAELSRLSGLVARDGKAQVFPPPKVEEKPEEKKEEAKATKALPDIFKGLMDKKEVLTKEQLDKVIDNPELINEAIYQNKVELMEALMEALPLMINTTVNREIMVSKAVTSFYSQNEDLKPHNQYVQMVLKEMEQTHKDKPYNELFDLTAKESRKRLGLKEPVAMATTAQTTTGTKPAFAGSKGGTATPISKDGKAGFFDNAAEELMDFQR